MAGTPWHVGLFNLVYFELFISVCLIFFSVSVCMMLEVKGQNGRSGSIVLKALPLSFSW